MQSMRIRIGIVIILLILCFAGYGQDQIDIETYADFQKYRKANMELINQSENKRLVVFMGNSITEGWGEIRPTFFNDNNYINRGISGQVTHQMLLRFRADVIDLKPSAVVILAGTNDIAQNSGFVAIDDVADNIFSMAELADHHGIKVIISSILPALDYPWRPGIDPAPKIKRLNELLQGYAAENDFYYLDYYSVLVDNNGGLKVPDFTSANDLVHPNKKAYLVMEDLVQVAINSVLNQ